MVSNANWNPSNEWWNQDYWEEGENKELPTKKCADCWYWSGNPGNMSTDFVCAVNIPKPSLQELDAVDGRKAYAYHYCSDFELKKNDSSNNT